MNLSISATKARQSFFKLIENTERPGASITITIDGQPKVVMMSLEDFEGWQETLEVIGDKHLMKGIKQALREIEKGKVISEAKVKKILHL